ncbi:MAG TPA: hypothetical protein VIS72_14290 [Anaerolineales bacterium]
MENTNSNNKTVMWIVGGCLAVIVCILAVFLFGFGGLVWLGSQTPENASISVGFPSIVSVGDDVQMTVSITNTSSETMKLSSIDFSLNYLDGFTITDVDPAYSDSGQYDSLGGGETFQTYYFNQTIEPGETLTVIFNGKAVQPGEFSGDIDVCIDSDFNCKTNIPRTVIK